MPEEPRNHDRLNGWKEIASYLGKSVRTVQRWEKELALPVRRIHTPTGEIVYAQRSELENWLHYTAKLRVERSLSGRDADSGEVSLRAAGDPAIEEAPPPTPAPAAPARAGRLGKSIFWYRTGLAGLTVLLVLAVIWRAGWWRPGAAGRAAAADRQPARLHVEHGRLKVFDAADKLLWERSFDPPLDEVRYRPDHKPEVETHISTIVDLESDGQKEIVFVAFGENYAPARLHVFNSDGSERFHHGITRTVTFGTTKYGPPWFVRWFRIIETQPGNKHILLATYHNLEFPSVAQKLTPRGEVVGEYWSNGHIGFVEDMEIGGRRTMLVGATCNESYTASLAVLDSDHPTGSAPAVNPYYRCMDCPPGHPLSFLVFPRMELSQVMNFRPQIPFLRQDGDGNVIVDVRQAAGKLPGDRDYVEAGALYRLNGQMQVLEAETSDDYRINHSRLEMAGRLKHRFGPQDEAQLFPVLSWNGKEFVRIEQPVLRARAARPKSPVIH